MSHNEGTSQRSFKGNVEINIAKEVEHLTGGTDERLLSGSKLMSICKTSEERFLMESQLGRLHKNLKERHFLEKKLVTLYDSLDGNERSENQLLELYRNIEERQILEKELIEFCNEQNESYQKEKYLLALCKNPDLCEDERLKSMTRLIRDGVDLNCIDDDGRTPLLLLCERGRGAWLNKCLKLLLSNMKPNQLHEEIHNCRAFHRLSKNDLAGDTLETFRLLIASGLDVNCKVSRYENALLSVCKHYYGTDLFELVRLLVENQIDVNCRDASGKNALLAMCERFDSKTSDNNFIIKFLVDNNIDLNCTDEWGQNALFYLLDYYDRDDRLELVRYFIDRGIDVGCRDSLHGFNVLSMLCLHKSRYADDFISIVELLMEKGIDVNTIDEYGEHVFIKICNDYDKDNLYDIIRLFIKYGVDINSKSVYGSSALVKICENYSKSNLIDIIQLLITNDIDVKCKNCNGRNVFSSLFRNPNYKNDNVHELVHLLIESGAEFEMLKEADRQLIISSYVRHYKRNNILHVFHSRSYGYKYRDNMP